MSCTNSPLASFTKISPNKTVNRKHAIDTITIHCVVGQVTVERLGEIFADPNRNASSNYGVGKDGRIGMYVEEKDRSWCSSNAANDHRAVTIEVASDSKHPYAVTDAAYNGLIALVADICKRNGKKKLIWFGDKTKTLAYTPKKDEMVMTVHRWFANKSCPGDYLYNLHGQIAAEVNKLLNDTVKEETKEPEVKKENITYPVVPFKVQVLVDDLNYRSEPAMGDNVEGVTGKGIFTITEVSDDWGKLKSDLGWIYLANPEYCKIGKIEIKQDEPKVFSIKVSKRTPIKMGYSENSGSTGKYAQIGVYTIVEEKSGWGKLKSGIGWISLAEVTRL